MNPQRKSRARMNTSSATQTRATAHKPSRLRNFALTDHLIESQYLALSCEDDGYTYHFWIDQVTHAPRNDTLFRITKPAPGDNGQRLVVQELRLSAKAHAGMVAEMFQAIDRHNLFGERETRLAAAAEIANATQAAAEQKRRLEQEAVSVHEETGRSPIQMRNALRTLEQRLHQTKQLLEHAAAADHGLDASATRAALRLLQAELQE